METSSKKDDMKNHEPRFTLEFKETAPGPPGVPDISDIKTTSLLVTWEPPANDGGSQVKGYMLEKRDPAIGRWLLVQDGIKEASKVVSALKADSTYEYRVFAKNDVGRGRPSGVSKQCKTGKPTVPGCPVDVNVSDVGTTSLTLSWEPPASDGGTPIIGYIIEHKDTNNDRWMRSQTNLMSETTFTVKGLNWMDDYHFRVTAENMAGKGPANVLPQEYRCAVGKWEQTRQFGDRGKNQLKSADGITMCCNERDVAVADSDSASIKVYDKNGKFKMALDTNQDLEAWQSSRPRQVKVNFTGNYFITDSTSHVRVFDENGTYERKFVALSPEKIPSDSHRGTKLYGLALDNKGRLYVGVAPYDNIPYISKHAQDGSHLGSFNVDTEPHYIAVTFQDTIIFSSENPSCTAKIVDQTGNILHTITPTAGVVDWVPKGIVCCRDTIFLSNNAFRGMSGIYCYSLTGEYIGSITETLPSSSDLVVTEDGNGIMVTNADKVTVFERAIREK
ncbi:myomesin-1-like [Amphiura filiformis]|uniref:myomesin-1-like n=1 Tax=Amphiura filiformis TaxID=82378 RepID=UPI003B21F113